MNRLYLILLTPLLFVGGLWSALRYLTCIVMNPAKAWNIAFQLDEMANVGANGEKNTTISARAARARNAGKTWGCVLCKVLDAVQAHHCDNSLK